MYGRRVYEFSEYCSRFLIPACVYMSLKKIVPGYELLFRERERGGEARQAPSVGKEAAMAGLDAGGDGGHAAHDLVEECCCDCRLARRVLFVLMSGIQGVEPGAVWQYCPAGGCNTCCYTKQYSSAYCVGLIDLTSYEKE